MGGIVPIVDGATPIQGRTAWGVERKGQSVKTIEKEALWKNYL